MRAAITEGKAKLRVAVGDRISKKLPVFYNPAMRFNRDVSILLLDSLDRRFNVADIMAGSGVRSIRFILECDNVAAVTANDASAAAIEDIKRNCSLNSIRVVEGYTQKGVPVENVLHLLNMDANSMLLDSSGFDYIDIDPFGTPNPFLSIACDRIARDGILAVTATDTSALAGTYTDACRRKYWALPLRNELMHEVGLRILIRKCQLVGAQYDRALSPIYSVATDHYERVFFRCSKGKKKADDLLKKHKYFLYCPKCGARTVSRKNSDICCTKEMLTAGPMWTGDLWDSGLAERMAEKSEDAVVQTIAEESGIPVVGFYDVHRLGKIYRLPKIPRKEILFGAVTAAGYNIAQSHLSPSGYRTDMPFDEFLKLIK